MAVNCLFCADMQFRNYSLTHSLPLERSHILKYFLRFFCFRV